MAPLSPRARRRIELAQICFDLTSAGQRELSAALTVRDLARAAVRAALGGMTADELVDTHLARLEARGVRPRHNVVSRTRVLLRRLLQERAKRRGRSTSTTPPEEVDRCR